MDDEILPIIQRLIYLLHLRIDYLEGKLMWNSEVLWVEKNERANPYERIIRLGGRLWASSPKNIISHIEKGDVKYYIKRSARKVDIVVAISPSGFKYLKTVEDTNIPGKLLILPDAWSYHDGDPDTPWTSNRALIKNGKSLKHN